MAGMAMTLLADAVVTEMLADIPERKVASVLSRVTCTAYVTTDDEPLLAADGEMLVTLPGSVLPTAVTVTDAAWPIWSESMSASANEPEATMPPVWSVMAVPDGELKPATMVTVATVPSAGAMRLALSTTVLAESTLTWAVATAAWSEAIVAAGAAATFVA